MDQVAFDPRPLAARLWSRLGFGIRRPPRPDGPYVEIVVVAVFDWRDRLRVVVSGKVQTTVAVELDGPVEHCVAKGMTAVLPPNYELPAPGRGGENPKLAQKRKLTEMPDRGSK